MFRVTEDLVSMIKKNHVPHPGAFAKTHFTPSLSVESIPLIEQKIHQEDVNKNLDIFFNSINTSNQKQIKLQQTFCASTAI